MTIEAANREPPVLLSVPEAGRLLGIGKTLAWDLVYKEELKVVRLAKRVLVPRSEIDRYVANKLRVGG